MLKGVTKETHQHKSQYQKILVIILFIGNVPIKLLNIIVISSSLNNSQSHIWVTNMSKDRNTFITKQVNLPIKVSNKNYRRNVTRNLNLLLALFIHSIVRSYYIINGKEMNYEVNIRKRFSWMFVLFEERTQTSSLDKLLLKNNHQMLKNKITCV